MNAKDITAIYKVEVVGDREVWNLDMLVEEGGTLASYMVAPDSMSTSFFRKRDEARIARLKTLLCIRDGRPILVYQGNGWREFATARFHMQEPRLRPIASSLSVAQVVTFLEAHPGAFFSDKDLAGSLGHSERTMRDLLRQHKLKANSAIVRLKSDPDTPVRMFGSKKDVREFNQR